MDIAELLQPILSGGIRHTNFFNGRILSAEDLLAEQSASRLQRQQFGQALGEGVVAGLEVELDKEASTAAKPVLKISRGLAVNRKGQMLHLANDAKIALLTTTEIVAASAGLFVDCGILPTETLTGLGAFILTATSAGGFEGKVPLPDFKEIGNKSGCGDRYIVEGVMFRLVPLPDLPEDLVDNSSNAATTLRNRVAHFCFGSHPMLSLARDPFNPDPQASALDILRQQADLTECDMPLALIIVSSSASDMVIDMWAARRLAKFPDDTVYPVQGLIFATILQFQAQFESLKSESNLRARTHFSFLPPFGRLPRDRSGEFFEDKFNRLPTVIERHDLNSLFRLALNYAPRPYADIEEVEIFFMADELRAAAGGSARPLNAYFVFNNIARQFCAPAQFIASGATFDLQAFAADLESAVEAFQCLRHFILSIVVDDKPGFQLTAKDHAGLHAIDQVLNMANAILIAATSRCLNNHALWLNFSRLAATEKNFVDIWLEIVLKEDGGARYPEGIKETITAIRPLIVEPETSDQPGLLALLADREVLSAGAKQREILGILERQICSALFTKLHGFIRDEAGIPLSGALIKIFDSARELIEQATSARDGAYLIESLAAGTYLVEASLTGHAGKAATITLSNLDSIQQDFVLPKQGTAVVTGVVSLKKSLSSTPLAGVIVTLNDQLFIKGEINLIGGVNLKGRINLKTLTNSKGLYRFEVPANEVLGQRVTLKATTTKFGVRSTEFALKAGTTTQDIIFTEGFGRIDSIIKDSDLVATK